MLIVRRSFFCPSASLSSLTDSAGGSTTSSSSRWPMSAPSMKNRRSRNMMSIMGMRLGDTSASISRAPDLRPRLMSDLLDARRSDGPAALVDLRDVRVRQDAGDLGVDPQEDVRD